MTSPPYHRFRPRAEIEVLTPAGSEAWFEEILALEDSDEAGFENACRRHGLTFHRASPWTAELRRRFNLK